MALSFKMASLVATVLILLLTLQEETRVWGLENDQVMTAPDDMVPVAQSPPEQVVVAIPGGADTITAGSPICLQCRCCSKSNPGTCQMTTCCSSFQCNRAGKCSLVQEKCGCGGCGGSN